MSSNKDRLRQRRQQRELRHTTQPSQDEVVRPHQYADTNNQPWLVHVLAKSEGGSASLLRQPVALHKQDHVRFQGP
jgi:hypothetical protein